jgi:hypothetical protein
MFGKIYVRKWTRREWVLLSLFAVIALAGVAVGHLNDPTSGTAGTGLIAELISKTALRHTPMGTPVNVRSVLI